jgi:glycosyltransferase involved in cell wall biosynthesis
MAVHRKIKRFSSKLRAKLRQLRFEIKPDLRKDLAVLAIMKNEGLNVQEWLDHYFWQGADHVYIIDNGSTDDLIEKVDSFAMREKVTLVHAPKKYMQTEHYRKVIKSERIKRKFKWLLIVDADEFCFAKKHNKLTEALKELEWFDLIYVQWTYFGCLNQEDHPASLRKELISCHDELGSHLNTKSFVKTDLIKRRSITIHKFRDAKSGKTITANDYFQLNHYQTQSLHFWQNVKMTRGDAYFTDSEFSRSLQNFHEFNSKCTSKDTTILEKLAMESN